jgi:hypothetical protein
MIVNRDILKRFLDQGLPLKAVADRHTGRTTAIALRAIVESIENPGVAVKVEDHHGTYHASRSAFNVAADIVGKLGLERMVLNASYHTITNNFSEVLS